MAPLDYLTNHTLAIQGTQTSAIPVMTSSSARRPTMTTPLFAKPNISIIDDKNKDIKHL
jgi:hypothetical protein